MPTKFYQRTVFAGVYAVFAVIVVVSVGSVVAVEKASEREAKADYAIDAIQKLKPPLVQPAVVIENAREAASQEVDRKINHQLKAAKKEILIKILTDAQMKAGVAMDKAERNRAEIMRNRSEIHKVRQEIRNLTGD